MRTWTVMEKGLAILAGLLLSVGFASSAAGDVTTEGRGSILIFPKVVWDGNRDTVIQITNSLNPTAQAHCFYINAANPGQWNETDFSIWLTKQQPTHWTVSSGRNVNFFDGFGSDGAGIDPGLIPPVPQGFQGELRCVQVDSSGAPLRTNALRGVATIRDINGDVSKYNAIAVQGNPSANVGNSDNVLDFNDTVIGAGEYSPCPNVLTFNHFAEGATDPVVMDLGDCPGGDCPIETWITVIPCSQDLENSVPETVTLSFEIFDEFERSFSTSETIECWHNTPLSSLGAGTVFNFSTLGTLSAHTRITPIPGHGAVLAVAEEVRRDGLIGRTWSAFNVHTEGNRVEGAGVVDQMVLPAY